MSTPKTIKDTEFFTEQKFWGLSSCIWNLHLTARACKNTSSAFSSLSAGIKGQANVPRFFCELLQLFWTPFVKAVSTAVLGGTEPVFLLLAPRTGRGPRNSPRLVRVRHSTEQACLPRPRNRSRLKSPALQQERLHVPAGNTTRSSAPWQWAQLEVSEDWPNRCKGGRSELLPHVTS